MNQADLKYTWTFSRDNWIIRFYLWTWAADINQVTFCKLFWAYIFAPIAVIVKLLWILTWPLRLLGRGLKRALAREADARKVTPEPKPTKPPKEEIPGRIAEFFAKEWPRRVAKIVGWSVVVPTTLAIAVVLGWVLYMLVAVWFADGVYWFLHTDAWLVVVQVVVAILIAGVIALACMHYVPKVDQRRAERRASKREAGEPTLGDVLVEGARAVKTNTCPRVEVK